QVWDGLTGTQLQSLTTHEADVLCLCVAEGESQLFVSGCDGKVVSVEKRQATPTSDLDTGTYMHDTELEDAGVDANAGSRRKRTRARQGWEWTIGSMRREHTHDVLALAIHDQSLDDSRVENRGVGAARKGPVLVSAGVDASLSLYSVGGFKTQASHDKRSSMQPTGPRALEPLPPVPVAFLARDPRLVLIMHNLHLDLWEVRRHARSFSADELGDLADETILDGGGDERGVALRLRLEPKTEKGGHLACAAISAAGDLVAVSTTKETKVYRLSKSKSMTTTSKRVRLPGACSPPAHALAFTRDGRRLVIAAASGDIRIVDLDPHVGDGTPHDAAAGRARAGAGARLVHCFEEHVDGVQPGGGGIDEGALPVSAIAPSASGKW
ncbi:unnamed protein product, partial [Hapterophycus canaliculatus]